MYAYSISSFIFRLFFFCIRERLTGFHWTDNSRTKEVKSFFRLYDWCWAKYGTKESCAIYNLDFVNFYYFFFFEFTIGPFCISIFNFECSCIESDKSDDIILICSYTSIAHAHTLKHFDIYQTEMFSRSLSFIALEVVQLVFSLSRRTLCYSVIDIYMRIKLT